jgi:Protein of unknown function (DUF760)
MFLPFDPAAFSTDSSAEALKENKLLHYMQQQPQEQMAQIAQAVSPEIQQLIANNIQGLMGALPANQFHVQVSTNRENLAGLLASAMMTGYFLRNVEQRMELDVQFSALN